MAKRSSARYLPGIGLYKFQQGVLGEGIDAIVRKAVPESDPATVFVVKIVSLISLAENKRFDGFQQSLQILRRLSHPGIVRLREVLRDSLWNYVILEYCPNSLRSYISERKKLEIPEARRLMIEILEALKYVHAQGVAHRDLKPENILLTAERAAKISDFGFAVVLDGKGLCTGSIGTPGYTSPECLSGKPYDGRKSDVWSAGLVLYAMVVGRLPWDTANPKQIANQIRRGRFEIPSVFGAGFARVIQSMLRADVKKRASADEVLTDPWLLGEEGAGQFGAMKGKVAVLEPTLGDDENWWAYE
jgi:serine/threonine protein kinase